MTEMKTWIERLAKRDSLRDIQAKTGISFSTLSRRLPDGLSAEQVIQFARGYDAPVIDGLIAAGFLSEADRLDAAAGASIASASDEQLAEEVLRRMKLGGEAAGIFDQPISELPDNVHYEEHRFGAPFSAPDDIEDELRGEPYAAERTDQGMATLDDDDR